MMNRRKFIRDTGITLGALSVLGASCAEQKKQEKSDKPMSSASDAAGYAGAKRKAMVRGLQLYTVRSLLAEDFFGTLDKLHDAGISELEFAGYYDIPLDEIKSYCDSKGFKTPSAHFSPDIFFDEPEKVLETGIAMGHRYLVFPWLPPEMQNAATFSRIAKTMNELSVEAEKNQMMVAYHNHDFEFKPDDSGTLPIKRLLEETDSNRVQFEMDLYWTVHAGYDPLKWLKEYPGRFTLCHVKDRSAEGLMRSVGQGEIPFKGIFNQHAFAHHFIEHDNPENPLESVRTSSSHLKEELGFI